MADVFDKEKRSEIMRAVKSSKNKSTEEKLIAYFKENKITGWRRNYKVYGKPDFVLPDLRIAIFVDGCFWHGHNCRNTHPEQNKEYWQRKIGRNMARDKEVTDHLERLGWNVIRIWECEFLKKNRGLLEKRLKALYSKQRTDG
ncbi:very short patch repair endonuclease [Otoolea muris]|uniref:very short patch repair endonuclease n=1 Tax=Otoolea muris TaxID=2941515 RepID=UPI00203F1EA7|nr:very short patch repair endonuclease [Otoolea muris]